jgi:hypothetical protein
VTDPNVTVRILDNGSKLPEDAAKEASQLLRGLAEDLSF